jgi:hypothetical protein
MSTITVFRPVTVMAGCGQPGEVAVTVNHQLITISL